VEKQKLGKEERRKKMFPSNNLDQLQPFDAIVVPSVNSVLSAHIAD